MATMTPVARGGGVTLFTEDLLAAIKLRDASLFDSVLARRVAAARAAVEGLEVAEDELDEALADFYAERDLFEDEQVAAWLADRRLDEDRVKQCLRDELLAEKLKRHLAPDAIVAERYRAARHDFTSIEAEVIEVASAGAAAELALAVREGELPWADAGRRAGGVATLCVRRGEAPEEIAAHLFAAQPGGIVGPAETGAGRYAVYRVLSKTESALTDDVQAQIRDEIWRAELARALAKDPLHFLA